ncbi:hypothetical protein APV28_2490 [Comamonas testosteroni]|nr:hypothetical protein APV28_2490 [Comamonas testosteroni]
MAGADVLGFHGARLLVWLRLKRRSIAMELMDAKSMQMPLQATACGVQSSIASPLCSWLGPRRRF